jgi:hypothetical protein
MCQIGPTMSPCLMLTSLPPVCSGVPDIELALESLSQGLSGSISLSLSLPILLSFSFGGTGD